EPDTGAGLCLQPLPQSCAGTCGHSHLGWACCHCSTQHRSWSTPWNVPPVPPFVLLQVLRRFLRIQHRKTMATATKGTAEPNSRLTELQAEPGASTASSACAENSARAVAEGRGKAGTAWTEGVATTNTLTWGISKTDPMLTETASPAPTLDFFQGKGVFFSAAGASHGEGHSPETRVLCHCGCWAAK
ncbi:hypothetical protein Nmel_002449, partial [Mimus melanotis]